MISATSATPGATHLMASGPPVREVAREELLRAADWRFLIPQPEAGRYDRLVLLGASKALMDVTVATGVAVDVTDQLPPDHTASVIVVPPWMTVEPRALAASLAQGGSLYVEIDRRQPANWWRTPAKLAAQLRAAGILPTGVYAVGRLGMELAPRRYIPIDEPGPFRWYASNVYRPLTGVQRIARVIASLAGSVSPDIIYSCLRWYAITATTDCKAPDEAVARSTTRRANRNLLGGQAVVFGDGGDRVVALRFAPGGERPLRVLKAPRSQAFNGRTEREQARMEELRRVLPGDLARAIPVPGGITGTRGSIVATEPYVHGRSLLASSGSWGASRSRRVSDLRIAIEWLAQFHLATVFDHRQWGSWETWNWLDAPFQEYTAIYGATEDERRLLDCASSYETKIAGATVPRVWQHSDYTVWNLARNGDALVVMDWEGARPGPPLCDALHLVTSWDAAVRRADGDDALRCFRSLFLSPRDRDPYRVAAHDSIARYNAMLGLDARLTPVLLLYHRLELAIRRAKQWRDRDVLIADPRADSQEVAVIGLLAEHAATLFPSSRSIAKR